MRIPELLENLEEIEKMDNHLLKLIVMTDFRLVQNLKTMSVYSEITKTTAYDPHRQDRR